MTKLWFKSSKIRWKSTKDLLNQRNSLVLCSIIILICSVSIWFIERIAEWLNTLFYSYSNLQNQSQQKFWDENDIMLTWSSFKDIHLSFYSNPTYIVAWWDVMLSRNIWYLAKKQWYDRIFKEWNYNPLNKFGKCNSNNCLLFLNLESLFYEPDNDIQMWWFDFRSNPNNIKTLMQYRWDKDFCLWAYSYDGKSARIRGWLVFWNRINENEIKADLQKMKNMDCSVKIISLHRGAEYRFSPNKWQKDLAHNLIDSWVDLILGWHSHIPWEFELYNGKYIFYSLWNFIFDQWWWKRATWAEFNYFYDADLKRNNVPTYISMLIWLKFEKKLMKWIDITLDQIELSSTTDGLFSSVWEESRNNLLKKINLTNLIF